MEIYKAYKFRIYPNKEQRIKLNSFLGTSRFIYNYYLNKKDKLYKKEKINYNLWDMKKDLKRLQVEYPWLKEIDGCILRTSLENLDRAYTNFFKTGYGYPKYKKKNNNESYRTVCIRSSYKNKSYENIKVDLRRRVIKLPKIEEIKIRGYRKLDNFAEKKIINVTVSKEVGKYYVSICVEENMIIPAFNLNSAVGLDIGVKNLVVRSDGIKYNAMKNIERLEKKIKGLNRWLARCEKKSNNREKVKIKLSRIYQKIRNIRKHYINMITNDITKENDLILTEDLNTKTMIENSQKTLVKRIINSSFREIIRQLEYKSKWLGKKVVKVSRYYASSRICSHCGARNEEVKDLRVREYECSKCKSLNDRDLNASINILMEGIKKYYKYSY